MIMSQLDLLSIMTYSVMNMYIYRDLLWEWWIPPVYHELQLLLFVQSNPFLAFASWD